jgi:hypothetical protein
MIKNVNNILKLFLLIFLNFFLAYKVVKTENGFKCPLCDYCDENPRNMHYHWNQNIHFSEDNFIEESININENENFEDLDLEQSENDEDETKESIEIDDSVVSINLSNVFSIWINRRIPIVVCDICKYCVRPKKLSLLNHFRKSHNFRITDIDDLFELILRINPELKSIESFPENPSNQPFPIPGLKLYKGYQCAHCNIFFQTKKKFKLHMKHIEKRDEERSPKQIWFQTFSEVPTEKSFFIVKENENKYSQKQLTQKFQYDEIFQVQQLTILDGHQFDNPFFIISNWREIIQQLSINDEFNETFEAFDIKYEELFAEVIQKIFEDGEKLSKESHYLNVEIYDFEDDSNNDRSNFFS